MTKLEPFRHKVVCTGIESIDIDHPVWGMLAVRTTSSGGDWIVLHLIPGFRCEMAAVHCSDELEHQITCPDCGADGLPARINGFHYCEQFQENAQRSSADTDESRSPNDTIDTDSKDDPPNEEADPDA